MESAAACLGYSSADDINAEERSLSATLRLKDKINLLAKLLSSKDEALKQVNEQLQSFSLAQSQSKQIVAQKESQLQDLAKQLKNQKRLRQKIQVESSISINKLSCQLKRLQDQVLKQRLDLEKAAKQRFENLAAKKMGEDQVTVERTMNFQLKEELQSARLAIESKSNELRTANSKIDQLEEVVHALSLERAEAVSWIEKRKQLEQRSCKKMSKLENKVLELLQDNETFRLVAEESQKSEAEARRDLLSLRQRCNSIQNELRTTRSDVTRQQDQREKQESERTRAESNSKGRGQGYGSSHTLRRESDQRKAREWEGLFQAMGQLQREMRSKMR